MANKGNKGLNNWKVVVLSLIGATTFWFFNELNKEYTTRLIYPLEFNFQRDSVVVMRPLPETINVDVTSGGWNLLRRTFILFNPTPITIELFNPTLIKFYTRATMMPIVRDQLDELKVNYLVTDTLFFDIEEKQSRIIGLSIDSANTDLRDNYRITSSIKLSQDSVEIIGPKRIIDTLTSPLLVSIDENRIDDDFDDQVEIKLPRPDVNISIPEEISVSFQVDRFDRISVQIPLEPINFPEDSTAYAAQQSIDIQFTVQRANRRDEYDASDFGLTLDYNLFEKSDSTVAPILIYAPEEADEIDLLPEKVKIVVQGK